MSPYKSSQKTKSKPLPGERAMNRAEKRLNKYRNKWEKAFQRVEKSGSKWEKALGPVETWGTDEWLIYEESKEKNEMPVNINNEDFFKNQPKSKHEEVSSHLTDYRGNNLQGYIKNLEEDTKNFKNYIKKVEKENKVLYICIWIAVTASFLMLKMVLV